MWIDQEHCGLTMRELEVACVTARAAGLDSFVRIAPTSYAVVTQCLEAGAGGIMAAMIATAAPAQTQLVSEDIMVKSPDAGIEIFVRNKRPANMTAFRPERTVVYVHGATYPSETAFDLKLGGVSWMEYIAQRGYDVYLLDLRGYGRSTRPKEMDEDAKANPPLVRNDTAIKDISTVVDFVLKRHLRVNGKGFPNSVFETRKFFEAAA